MHSGFFYYLRQLPLLAIADSLGSLRQQSPRGRCISIPKNVLDYRRIVRKPWLYHSDRTSYLDPTMKLSGSLSGLGDEVNRNLKARHRDGLVGRRYGREVESEGGKRKSLKTAHFDKCFLPKRDYNVFKHVGNNVGNNVDR